MDSVDDTVMGASTTEAWITVEEEPMAVADRLPPSTSRVEPVVFGAKSDEDGLLGAIKLEKDGLVDDWTGDNAPAGPAGPGCGPLAGACIW